MGVYVKIVVLSFVDNVIFLWNIKFVEYNVWIKFVVVGICFNIVFKIVRVF